MRLALRKPTAPQLDRLLGEQSGQQLTYAHVGATAGTTMPAGYRQVHESIVVGDDPANLDRIGEGLFTWELHRNAGLQVHPAGRADTEDTDVVLLADLLGVKVLLACRVVRVIQQPDRVGFSYGTLPMHPESGEEAFIAERVGGQVRFTVTAFSSPTGMIRQLGSPLRDRVQDHFTRRYLRAAKQLAAGGQHGL